MNIVKEWEVKSKTYLQPSTTIWNCRQTTDSKKVCMNDSLVCIVQNMERRYVQSISIR
jgi:hypothetical protein